jgi:osmotically inducible lipoprotein OsmB
MKILALFAVSALALAACGHNVEQRAATGAIAGAAIAGPIGAAQGASLGSSISRAIDK